MCGSAFTPAQKAELWERWRRGEQMKRYRAVQADKRAWKAALRPKPCALALHDRLRKAVTRGLRQQWSPQQIAGWLARTYPGREAMNVSHETIYKSLFVQARGVLKQELAQYLRTRRQLRGSRHALKGRD